MASVNKVILIGNLGADPELKYTPNNKAVCNLSVATNETWKDGRGQKQERVEWHRVVVWNEVAENCSKYLAKGRSVYIEGRIQTRSWEDKDGQKRYATDIVAERVVFLGGGDGGSAAGRGGGGGGGGRGRSPGGDGGSSQTNSDGGPPLSDDDIPF